jgi:hypothetical protein
MQFKYLKEHVTGCRYTPPGLLSCENHCKVLKKKTALSKTIIHKYIIKTKLLFYSLMAVYVSAINNVLLQNFILG